VLLCEQFATLQGNSAFKKSGTLCTVSQHHITKDRNSGSTTV